MEDDEVVSFQRAVQLLDGWFYNHWAVCWIQRTINQQLSSGRTKCEETGYKVQQQNMENSYGGERVPYQAFTEYVGYRLVIFFLTPVENPTSNVWYKMVPVGWTKLAKQMQELASFASLDGKFTNTSSHKTVIQSLRDEFHPLEYQSPQVSHTGHLDLGSIASYSHNPLEKQRRIADKLAGSSSNATTTTNANRRYSTQVLREVIVNSPALPTTVENNTTPINGDSISIYCWSSWWTVYRGNI